MKWKTKSDLRNRRHLRVRNKISGNADRPRMAIFKSNKHLYVQFIDDLQAHTLAAVSTVKGSVGAVTVDTARKLGQEAAETAKAKGIERVVFDRGGFKFGGQVKAVADGAREGGLKF